MSKNATRVETPISTRKTPSIQQPKPKETPEQRLRRKKYFVEQAHQKKLQAYHDAEPGSLEERELDLELGDEIYHYNCVMFDLNTALNTLEP